MSKKVNLKEILKATNPMLNKDGRAFKLSILAMKEACCQTLELAAENAETEKEILPDCGVLKSVGVVDKQSILNTIKQIE